MSYVSVRQICLFQDVPNHSLVQAFMTAMRMYQFQTRLVPAWAFN